VGHFNSLKLSIVHHTIGLQKLLEYTSLQNNFEVLKHFLQLGTE